MASHGLSDIAATVVLPKTEYEELIRQSEELKIIKKVMVTSDDALPLVVLKHMLGIEEGEENETKIIAHDTMGNTYPI